MNAKENLLRVIHHDDPQWVPYGMEGLVTYDAPVIERPEEAGPDAWGVMWDCEESAQGGTYPKVGGRTVTDPAHWREQVHVPEVDSLNWEGPWRTGRGDLIHPRDVDRDEYLVCGMVGFGVFERSWLLLGMTEALAGFAAEPDLMYDLAALIADYKIRLIERFHEEAHLDMVWFGDDWGTQRGLFVAPNVWRAIVKTHTQRIYDCMLERGILIDQHSDGKIDAIFGDMVEMGARVFNPAQPCNDLAGLKQEYAGRITFCGGIDSQFVLARPGVTPEEVRAEVRRRIDELAEGGGYVAAPSHYVPYDDAILNAMEGEIRTYGREFYRQRRGKANA